MYHFVNFPADLKKKRLHRNAQWLCNAMCGV